MNPGGEKHRESGLLLLPQTFMQGMAIRVGQKDTTTMSAIYHDMARGLFNDPPPCRFPTVFINLVRREAKPLRML
jgi:hypothetical protein